jgi:hypothetical protein
VATSSRVDPVMKPAPSVDDTIKRKCYVSTEGLGKHEMHFQSKTT